MERPLAPVRRALLRICNSFLPATKRNSGSTVLRFGFSKADTSGELSWLFENTGCEECRNGSTTLR